MKVAHVLVLLGDGHCLEIIVIACGLEIATDQEEIYFALEPLNVSVDRVKLAVAATFHGNLGWNRSMTSVVMCGTLNLHLLGLMVRV